MDVDVDTAVTRVRSRENEKNRYIDIRLQYRLREQYLEIAKDIGGVIIHTGKSIEEAFQAVRASVMEVLQKSSRACNQ